jgi:hypothetical protein
VKAIDLFCGLGGWTEGLLAHGYDVTGYDIEAHEYDGERYPAKLVLADIRGLNGAQFADAALIVASPPCQEFSYMAMPWTRAKQIARALRGEDEFPEGYRGSRTLAELTALFDACFRIQREACEAAGRHIPLVVENVKGAQPWIGRAKWSFGSYYLWGDVPALMPPTIAARKFNPDGTAHGQGSWFAIADSKNRGAKNTGGSWFNIAHNTTSGVANNPDGRKNPGFRFDGSGRSFQSESVNRHVAPAEGYKSRGMDWSNRSLKGQDFTRIAGTQGANIGGPQHEASGIKQGGSWFHDAQSASRLSSSKSPARKAASARIAKIPFALSSWIARTYAVEARDR